MPADELVLGHAQHGPQPFIQKREATVAVQHVNRVRRAVDDEAVQLFAGFQLRRHVAVLPFQLALAERGFHRGHQLRGLIGFFHVVEGATVQRVFDAAEAGVAADHDDLGAQLVFGRKLQHVVAAHTRHDEIEQHNVVVLRLERGERRLSTQRFVRLVAV